MPTSQFVINIVIYQICWLACILGGAQGMPWLGVLLVAIAIAYHLYTAVQPGVEGLLIASAAVIGAVWDSFLVAAGWLVYPSGVLLDNTAPYWIIALWAGFAITFNVSLAWFKDRLLLASLLGAIGGPLAFLAGERLGAVEFTDPFAGLTALAIGWALLMPLMMVLARRWNGFSSEPRRLASMTG